MYFMDPLCGWCYGFSEVISGFKKNHPDISYELITGGMITGEREGPVDAQFADYILQALPRLQEYTGAEIGEPFRDALRNRSLYMSSVKPSLAMHAVKHQYPEQLYAFTTALQKRQYLQGEDLQSDSTYKELFSSFGWDANAMLEMMHSEENRYRFQQDMAFSSNAGIQGYPAVVIRVGEAYYLAARGYTVAADLENTYRNILAETKPA